MNFFSRFILFFLLFSQSIVFALEKDSSLDSLFNNTNLSFDERIDTGIRLTNFWLRQDNVYALEIAGRVKELSLDFGNSKYIIKGLINFGKALEWTQQYKAAKENYRLAYNLASQYNFENLKVDATCGLAHTHQMLEELDSAVTKYIEAIKLVEKGTDFEKKADVYVLFAEYNRGITRYDIALQYLNKTRTLVNQKQVQIATEIEMYNRYAAVWNETGTNLDSAIYYSELCIELGERINDLHVVATAHNELASILVKKESPDYLQHIQQAIDIWKKMHYLAYEGRAILNLFYFTNNNDAHNGKLNIELIEDFLNRAKDKDLPLLKQDLYHVLSAEYERSGNTKKALEALKVYTEIVHHNSLNLQQKALNEAQEQFEAEKNLLIISEQKNNLKLVNEEKLREQEMRKIKEAESRNFLILSVALFFVLMVVIVLIIRSRKQNQNLKIEKEKTYAANEQLAQALNEKEILLKEIHHRVKNNLQIVVGLLELQSNRIDAEPVKKALLESINRVRSMSLVHQKLYLGDDLGKVDVKDYIISLIREIEFASNKRDKKLEKVLSLPSLIFDIDSIIPLGLIITELLTNSFKYAFDKNVSEVRIEIKLLETGKYLLVYRDNGPGLPQDFEISKSRSLGMRLIQQLTRQLNGEVNYIYEDGAMFLITFEDSSTRKKTA